MIACRPLLEILAINESTCKLSVGKVFYLKEIEETGYMTERFTPF